MDRSVEKKETNAHKQKPQMSFENWDSFTFTSDKSTLYFTIIAERTGAREWTLIESQLQIVIVSTSYANNTISYAQVLHKIYIESMHTKIINRRNEILFYMHKSIQYVRDKLKKKWDARKVNSRRTHQDIWFIRIISTRYFSKLISLFQSKMQFLAKKKFISNLRLRIIP